MKNLSLYILICISLGLVIQLVILLPSPKKSKPGSSSAPPRITKDDFNPNKVKNLYFLKVPKCGSTTLMNLLARFAWNHNISVVTTKRSPSKGGKATTSYFVESLNPTFIAGQSEKYNMFFDHSRYEPEPLQIIMQEPLTRISIIRNPLRRYLYYLNMETKEPSAKTFLEKFKNCSSCNLKIPLVKLKPYFTTPKWFGIMNEKKGLSQHLDKLNEVFLVGITDYYDESIVLMRRKLGWSLRDVVYFPVHVHNYTQIEPPEALYKQFCKLMPDECELYENFNNTFWKMVDQEGDSFSKEVTHYKSVLHKLSEFCTPAFSKLDSKTAVDGSTKTTIEGSKWNEPFDLTYTDCAQMRLTDKSFRPFFFFKQNSNFGCEDKCNLNQITQARCTQICKATRASRPMELYTNATLDPLLD